MEKNSESTKIDEVYYWLLKCYLYKSNEKKIEEIYNNLINKNSIWYEKATLIYNEYEEIKNQKKNLEKTILLDDEIINEINQAGGDLELFKKLYKNGISKDLYLNLIKNKVKISEFLNILNSIELNPDELFMLIKKNVSLDDYIYLTQKVKEPITKSGFFSYIESDTNEIKNITKIYKLGFNEEKYLKLKNQHINISFFIKSIESGFTEKDFYKFKDRIFSINDIEYYNFFIEKGNNKNDFYLGLIFGKSGYKNYEKYKFNRTGATISLIFSITSSFLSIGFVTTGIVMDYMENITTIKRENALIKYFESTKPDEKLSLLDKMRTLGYEKNQYQTNKIIFYAIGGSIGILTVIPIIFCSLLFYKNYKLLNIISSLKININWDSINFGFVFKL